LALNFRLGVNMLQLIYALKKHNNWRFPTPPQDFIWTPDIFTNILHILLMHKTVIKKDQFNNFIKRLHFLCHKSMTNVASEQF
jgi:hypothetical protein